MSTALRQRMSPLQPHRRPAPWEALTKARDPTGFPLFPGSPSSITNTKPQRITCCKADPRSNTFGEARVKQSPANRVGHACRAGRGGAGRACSRCGSWSWARKLATERKRSTVRAARARGLPSAVHDRGRTFSGHSRQPGGEQHDGAHHETHPPGTPKHASSVAYGTPSRTAAV